tara:strand:+ start:551 stop:2176 length:1626 start_codon:yes stop_codon:yes gene_type:complete
MCGGGDLGSADSEDNNKEKGSGNSFTEGLANLLTGGDGFEYRDGVLTMQNKRDTYGQAVAPGSNSGVTNVQVSDGQGGTFNVPSNETKKYNDRLVQSGIFGALTGGLPGLIGGVVGNSAQEAASSGLRTDTGGEKNSFGTSLKNLFSGPNSGSPEERAAQAYEDRLGIDPNRKISTAEENENRVGGGNSDFNFNGVPAPTVRMPEGKDSRGPGIAGASDMSKQAALGAFESIPNPDYDPSDPMSSRFLINPSYEQLLAYKMRPAPMAMGGYMTKRGGGIGRPLSIGNTGPDSLSYSEPLQQYGNYLEGEYGDSGFEQKKDNFLREVSNNERRTFNGGGISDLSGYRGPMQMPDTNSFADESPFPFNIIPFGGGEQLQLFGGLAEMQGAANFAEGGELEVAPSEGGNEKDMIADAVSAVKGDMSEEQASIVLGQFLANYGEEALRDLVEKVKSGELDDTVERFANGEAGEVNGPGDGSGVDDKVPASLEGQQDVLLADGEFVLRKKTADALEKKYGGGFLDTINEAENDAPRVVREYMAKTA